ncbi:MAG: roadblock/LC7 domain-containing protein [Promethearchaeota archaeon]
MTAQDTQIDREHYDLSRNPLSEVLDELIEAAASFPLPGLIDGAFVLDGDGRLLATSGRYIRRFLWELSALSAALAGVAQQGQVYLQARPFADIMVLYDDKQLYVCNVGLSNRSVPVLLAIIADVRTNIGFIRIRMRQTAKHLLTLVESDVTVQKLLGLHEEELESAMRTLNDVFTGGYSK